MQQDSTKAPELIVIANWRFTRQNFFSPFYFEKQKSYQDKIVQYASIQSLGRQERISSDAEVLWAGLCLADQGRHAHFNQLGGGQPKMVMVPVYTVQPHALLRGGPNL